MKKRNSRNLIHAVLLPFAAMVLVTVCTTNESSAQSQVACELTKMNVVYVGVDNPVIIAASNCSVNDLEVAITNGQIAGLAGKYMISPKKAGEVKLEISAKGKLLGTRTLRALPIPNPHACIMLKVDDKKQLVSKGEITLKQLVNVDAIQADLSDFLFDVNYKVVSFKLNVVGAEGINLIENSESELITERQKDLLKRMRPGQRVFFEEIKAIGPDGITRELNDIMLKISG